MDFTFINLKIISKETSAQDFKVSERVANVMYNNTTWTFSLFACK